MQLSASLMFINKLFHSHNRPS